MNDDAFEKKLESLAGAMPRPDPTPQWKADILARARREAAGAAATPATTTAPRRVLPPRWLMMVWCMAWVAIALMHFSTPADTAAGVALAQLAETKRDIEAGAGRHSTDFSSLTLLAFHRELSSNASTTRFDIP